MNLALAKICHPATMQLLRHQSRAKLTRVAFAFRSPRRQVLTIVALALGCVWVFQAVASVMFRQSADPQKLMTWLPLGLFVYSVWHLIKTVIRKPVEPFEWTPAEKELVCAAPISRTQLISYRMASILSSAFIKALCFSVVMIPDLNIWAAGLVGMFLGLTLVDLIRVGFELFFHGLSKREKFACRSFVLGSLISCAGWAMFQCLTGPEAVGDIASPGAMILFQSFIGEIFGLVTTPIGTTLLAPFTPFSQVIMAENVSSRTIGFTALSTLIVLAAAGLVYRLDWWMKTRTIVKEQIAYQRGLSRQRDLGRQFTDCKSTLSVPWRLSGFGSLAWRQLRGAYHYRMSLAISLGIPTLLCCIPLMADHEPFFMLLNIAGAVVFYSFLLLPSALVLDFRRDVHRIAVLKSLPIGPTAVTLGQLAVPVLICSAFQWCVLLICVFSGSVIAWQALLAAILLLPVNTLIFAIENFIFLLSPYRRNQEGIDVFLRTILTFTGKGILFAFGLALLAAWAFASRSLAGYLGMSATGAGLIFGLGAWSMTTAMATTFVYGIVKLYDRFDPSQDAPSES